MKFILCVYFVVQIISATALKFEEITSKIFGDPGRSSTDIGIMAAYGHFNSDEYTDVVTLQKGGYMLQILIGSDSQPYFQKSFNCSFPDIITSVVPGDYNGDSQLDLLVTFSNSNNGRIEVKILWGSNGSIACNSDVSVKLLTQPFVVDFDGDMIPDIIGDDVDDKKRHVWISKGKRFEILNLTAVTQSMKDIHSSGLIDLNNDMVPDILITGETYIEPWINTGMGFVLNQTKIPYPYKHEWTWQSTYVDMNLDGKMNHIMPVCKDRPCQESEILIWNEYESKWDILLADFINPNDQTVWGFKLPLGTAALVRAALQVTLRAGDVDMDGYPDFITVLQSKKDATDVRAFILRNIPCNNNCTSGRTLEIVWDVPGLKDITNVHIAAFFDLFEDGTLDILVANNMKQESKIHALRNTEIFDSCFLKVLVLNGLCQSNCSVELYGTNQPGPMVRYNMTTQDGIPLVSTSVQLSQSAHFPLQLPYSHFGLGQTPNFIDVLTVSIPASFNKSVHKREWVQIIPNSQIVIIPSPPHNEKKWVKKLFVTPSDLVVLTLIALVGTCIFLGLLVFLLHCKERREDKKEKMQDAYRFHFDAM